MFYSELGHYLQNSYFNEQWTFSDVCEATASGEYSPSGAL